MMFGIMPVSFLPQAQPELLNQHRKPGQGTPAPNIYETVPSQGDMAPRLPKVHMVGHGVCPTWNI